MFMALSPLVPPSTWAAHALASLPSPINPLHSQQNHFICKQHSDLSISTSHLQSKSSFSQKHSRTMISSRKLAQLAKKWQRMVASSGQRTASIDGCCSTATVYVADKGLSDGVRNVLD
uniref:Uncharacterized protein n=1 Tax=Oryza punctata TaxID=4537 RepID=A0A0E0M451_ORYPU